MRSGRGARSGRVPDAAVRRLPVYLRVLEDLRPREIDIVSSAELARRTGFSSEQIRKDLTYFGAFGTRGVGYRTETLSIQLREILGLDREVPAALVGAGNLGTALARYNILRHRDVRIVGIFDNDPQKVGTSIEGVPILSTDDLEKVVPEQGIRMAVITVPAEAAQEMASRLVQVGVEAILNFSPTQLRVPPGVYVQNIDLSIELRSLAYYVSAGRRQEDMGSTRG